MPIPKRSADPATDITPDRSRNLKALDAYRPNREGTTEGEMNMNLAAVAKAHAELIQQAQEILARELDPEGDKSRAYDELLALLDAPHEREIRRAYEQAMATK